MLSLVENEIKFTFKTEDILKYDELISHTECSSKNKKGVDFLYNYHSHLMLIEVKDFNSNISNRPNHAQKSIIKKRIKSLGYTDNNPFEIFTSNIIQKLNDTLLDMFSCTLMKKTSTKLNPFISPKEKITFILVLDLSYELQTYLPTIQDNLNQKLKKFECIFNIKFAIINLKSQPTTFTLQRI